MVTVDTAPDAPTTGRVAGLHTWAATQTVLIARQRDIGITPPLVAIRLNVTGRTAASWITPGAVAPLGEHLLAWIRYLRLAASLHHTAIAAPIDKWNDIVEFMRRVRVEELGESADDIAERGRFAASSVFRWERGWGARADSLFEWLDATGVTLTLQPYRAQR